MVAIQIPFSEDDYSSVRHLLIAIRHSAFLLFFVTFVSFSATATDSKQLANAQALIARAERVSSLTQVGSSPFFVQANISHAASKLTGSKGVYKIWWAANDRWREEAEADNLKGLQIRNSQGLWLPSDLDPKLAAIFADGQGYPFRGELQRWNEEIVGLKERKLDNTYLSCVEVQGPELQRELCFDPRTGVLTETTSQIRLQKWQFLVFEPDTATPVPVRAGKSGGYYLGEDSSPTAVEFITKYADFTAIGDKIVPKEIRHTINGRVILIWKMVSIASGPKAPFAPAVFLAPDGYQLWPGCDRYQPPTFSKDFWRQAPTVLTTKSWLLNGRKAADGVQITVGADGQPERVALIGPAGKPSKLLESTFMQQTYEPAICDGKGVRGTLLMDFSYGR